jgi:hypothetical protein
MNPLAFPGWRCVRCRRTVPATEIHVRYRFGDHPQREIVLRRVRDAVAGDYVDVEAWPVDHVGPRFPDLSLEDARDLALALQEVSRHDFGLAEVPA